jgi:6-pyruvoyltetrahydropterin/6-carboxytetrahydropterin synthase
MSKTKISRRFTFEAAHFLPDHPGKCKNLHGHRWELIVEIAGMLQNGMVMDYADLKKIVEENVIDQFDHKVLNEVVHFIPTSELLANHIVNMLIGPFMNQGVYIQKIILKETENSFCEVIP